MAHDGSNGNRSGKREGGVESLGPFNSDCGANAGEVVSLALLRTCFSEVYGKHISRMFQDLLSDLSQAFVTAAKAAANRGVEYHPSTSLTCGEGEGAGVEAGAACGGEDEVEAKFLFTVPVFHVTEYDVTQGQYPESWERYAGYMLPGGLGSAYDKEPWMVTLLEEAKDLRKSGKPVLGICLGHQVMAQALGGRVRLRNGLLRHYGLQESEFLATPAGSVAANVIPAAIAAVGQGRVYEGEGHPRLKLLYHHNDEVVDLPEGTNNISTSRTCLIHGMMAMTVEPEGRSTLNLLTFQAHPEFNYEYGRKVIDGLLKADIEKGHLTRDMASQLKKQVSDWNHEEFPVALELMRQLFDPIVPRSNGGSKAS